MKILFFLVFIAIFSSACQKDVEGEEITFGIRHDKDLADYEAVASAQSTARPDFASVIAFSYSLDGSQNHNYTATGTLIAPQWILTAGHNFFVAEEQSAPANVSGISVLTGNDPNNPLGTIEVESLTFHPSWLTENEDFVKANDLCLVKLKTAINNIPTAEFYTTSTEAIGGQVWFCGFGDYSNEAGQDKNLLSKKHAIENILDRKNTGIVSTANGVSYTGGLLAFDFDNPAGTINSLGDDLVNSDEALLGTGGSSSEATEYEGTTVQGDSGGPLFVKDGSTWKVAGVLSGGATDPISNHQDGSYGDISLFIRVSTHKDWIQSVIK